MAAWPYSTDEWQQLRTAKLARDPWCHPCSLRSVRRRANTVDHVVAIAAGGPAFPPLTGLMSMCTSCHNSKTRAVDHPRSQPGARRFKGFDVDGNPIDPDDFWHRGASKDGVWTGGQTVPGSSVDLLSERQIKSRSRKGNNRGS